LAIPPSGPDGILGLVLEADRFFANGILLKQLRAGKNVFLLLPGSLPLLNCHLVRCVSFLSAREISFDREAHICSLYSFSHKPELSSIAKVVAKEWIENGPAS